MRAAANRISSRNYADYFSSIYWWRRRRLRPESSIQPASISSRGFAGHRMPARHLVYDIVGAPPRGVSFAASLLRSMEEIAGRQPGRPIMTITGLKQIAPARFSAGNLCCRACRGRKMRELVAGPCQSSGLLRIIMLTMNFANQHRFQRARYRGRRRGHAHFISGIRKNQGIST